MKLLWSTVPILCALTVHPVAAAPVLPVAYAERSPDGHQIAWHTTLDLRGLPANTRPASVAVRLDTHQGASDAVPARVTVALNGVVIGRGWADQKRETSLAVDIEDRLLSTRNHLVFAVTSTGEHCPGTTCALGDIRMDGPIRVTLAPATQRPVSFAQYVTRFRAGLSIKADARFRALAERAADAIAPLAPRQAKGPAEVVVSHEVPPGTSPELRFDTGPVEIRNREGAVVYDRRRLDDLTIMQVTTRGETPVLWVRPGRLALPPAPFELDYGRIAMFGPGGREIAFGLEQDHVLQIVYAAQVQREAQLGRYWRFAVLAAWLVITAGFLFILRRMPPLQPRAT